MMQAQSLQTLIELARLERDAALARLADLLRVAERARQSLAVLRGYASDYDDRGRHRQGDVRDPSAEGNRRVFQDRLGVALEAQEREVAAREQACTRARAQVEHCERRVRSLETLDERSREQARRSQARRDQKTTDEIAQRAIERSADGLLQANTGVRPERP